MPDDETTAGERGSLGRPPIAARTTALLDRWAIVVGISTHKHEAWNLRFASRDAEAVAALLQTPEGGAFAPERIVELIDEKATTGNLNRALRTFLKKPARGDLVLLYFACHGAPDLDRPDNLYLITHDTEADDISGTAVPMRDIDLALRENLIAERVVIIADTCHSGGIGAAAGRRAVGNDAGVINAYLQRMGGANRGVALLTSAEANEVSIEGPEWGGGHGVFTHFLLEGMRGKADVTKDGIVGAGELFEYVRAEVQKATNGAQHPVIGASPFDRNLPMAVTAQAAAKAHFDLGSRLYELGWWVPEVPEVLAMAVNELTEAERLYATVAHDARAEVSFELGRGLLATGAQARAVTALDSARRADPEAPPEAGYYLGLALARQGELGRAAEALSLFSMRHPDNQHAGWASEVERRLRDRSPRQKRALLIGLARFADTSTPTLLGPENDVSLLRDCLINQLSFPRENVATILSEQATRDGVLGALYNLRRQSSPADVVVVYFSGHTVATGTEAFLLVHDALTIAGAIDPSSTITATELHEQLESLPGYYKTLVIDGECNTAFLERAARTETYASFFATSPGEASQEEISLDGNVHGAFTRALVDEIKQERPPLMQRRVLDGVAARLRSSAAGQGQTPLLVGTKNQRLFAAWDHQDYLWLSDFSHRHSFTGLRLDELEDRYPRDLQNNSKLRLPRIHYSFGRAFLEQGSYRDAARALGLAAGYGDDDLSQVDIAVAPSGAPDDTAVLLATAMLRTQDYDGSLGLLRASTSPDAQAQIPAIAALRVGRRNALLVGIGRYGSADLAGPRGAPGDVEALRQVLVARYGFSSDDIHVLSDRDATRDAILNAFRDLVKRGQREPALFFFSGLGSLALDDRPTILAADSRTGAGTLQMIEDIDLRELSTLVGAAPTNLITVFDTAWSSSRDSLGASRFAARSSTARRGDPSRPTPRDRLAAVPLIGRVTLAWNPGDAGVTSSESASFDGPAGDLTPALVRVLRDPVQEPLTCAAWAQEAGRGPTSYARAWVQGEGMDEVLFSNSVIESEVQRALAPLTREPLRALADFFRDAADSTPASAELQLNLGIALAALGDVDAAVVALESAVRLQGASALPVIHLHLGRVLYEQGRDLAGAVRELRRAAELDPTMIPTQYYYGQALRALAQRDNLAEAAKALQIYLEKGAPLGHAEEVQRFLRSRSAP